MKLAPRAAPGSQGVSTSEEAARPAGVTRVAGQRSRHRLAQLIRVRWTDGWILMKEVFRADFVVGSTLGQSALSKNGG